MTIQEAIEARHSVRKYISKPLDDSVVEALQNVINDCNREGNLHIQLVLNETKAFNGIFAYGKFYGVENYIVIVGRKTDDLDLRSGYYGERIVLEAQRMGLNTCWVGLSYHNVKSAYSMADGEKLVCMIAIGYGATQGIDHKRKSFEQLSKTPRDGAPEWYIKGVESACLCPTAINQQKFSFKYAGTDDNGKGKVIGNKGFSVVGYTQIDFGIAKLHFELGAGKENFCWVTL